MLSPLIILSILYIIVNGLNDDIMLVNYPIIMSHDSASGEIVEDNIVMDWTKTQSVGLLGQLNCGTRSFDYRPYLKNDIVYAHHGDVVIYKAMEGSINEIKNWLSSNSNEFIIIYISHIDGDNQCSEATLKLLSNAGVYTIQDCNWVAGKTYGTAKVYGKLASGGSMIAIFECVNENYDPSINCYGPAYVCYDSWPAGTTKIPFHALQNHLQSVTSVDPIALNSGLWMTQAHWQSTAATVSLGTLHNSTLLLDESLSSLNLWIADQIRSKSFKYLNFLELENVCDNGLEVMKAISEVY